MRTGLRSAVRVYVVWIACLALLPVSSLTLVADNAQLNPNESVSFKRDIAPIFIHQCQSCHGPRKSKGKFRLDSFERLMKAGVGKETPVVAGKPQESEIYRRLMTSVEDDRMPQKADALPAGQIELVKKWIEQGAKFDGPDRAAPLSGFAVEPSDPPAPLVYPKPVPITALAFSPDGKRIAAGGYNEVTLWDASDGHLVERIGNIPQRTLGLAFSPDGKLLAVAGGTPGVQGEVRLIYFDESKTNQLLERIADVMTVVRFSPDGTRLAAGGADNAIRVYEVSTVRRELYIEQHADWVTDIAYSPDGSQIASASRDKSCRVFDAKTGAMEAVYAGSEETVSAVAWNDDGKHVFSAGRDRMIRAWNAKDGKDTASVPRGAADLLRLATAPGLLFACAADGSVRTYSQAQLTPVGDAVQSGDCAYAIAVDLAGHRVAAGFYDGSVRVWKIGDGKELIRFVAAPRENPNIETRNPKQIQNPKFELRNEKESQPQR